MLLSAPLSYAQAPQRIISLSPNTTELIYSLGVEDRLLAVSRFSNYPPQAAAKPIIGDAFSVNTEQLVSLQPDLIVAWDSEPFSNSLKHLPKTKVWASQPHTIEDLLNDIQALADIVDSPKQAEVLKLKQSIKADHGLDVDPDGLFIVTTEALKTGPLILPGGSGFSAEVSTT